MLVGDPSRFELSFIAFITRSFWLEVKRKAWILLEASGFMKLLAN
jgi:hypothetical protein